MNFPVNQRSASSSAKRPKRSPLLLWWIPGLLSLVLWLSLALRHLILYRSPRRTLTSLILATRYVMDHSTLGLAIGALSAVLVVVLVVMAVIRHDQRPLALALFVFFGSLLMLLVLGAFLFAGSFA
jgi:hypothetical protein